MHVLLCMHRYINLCVCVCAYRQVDDAECLVVQGHPHSSSHRHLPPDGGDCSQRHDSSPVCHGGGRGKVGGRVQVGVCLVKSVGRWVCPVKGKVGRPVKGKVGVSSDK